MNQAYQNIWELPKDQWESVILSSENFSEIARKMNRAPSSRFNDKLKNYCEKYNISLDKFNLETTQKYTLEEILVENSSVSRKTLREYLAKYPILEYKCAICGNIGEWNNQSLTLQLDHINGINNDHRKENLRWLCPNCHSQTPTYTGKNKTKKEVVNFSVEEAILALKQTNNVNQANKLLGCAQGGANWVRINQIKKDNNIIQKDDIQRKEKKLFEESHIAQQPIKKHYYCKKCGRPLSTKADYCQTCIHEFQRKCEWPTREELKDMIRTTPFLQIGKKYNVSDNAVRKWCINYGLPSKKVEIKKYSDEEWASI